MDAKEIATQIIERIKKADDPTAEKARYMLSIEDLANSLRHGTGRALERGELVTLFADLSAIEGLEMITETLNNTNGKG